MRVDMALAGFTAGWEFPGSLGFDEWARCRPWLLQGGVAVMRTANSAMADVLYPSICRCIRGAHGDERRLDIVRVDVGEETLDPTRALFTALEIMPELSAYEAREPLRVRLADRALVLILSEQAPVPPAEWERFALLIEHYAKSVPAVHLCVVVLDHRGAVSGEPSFDFLVGRSTHLVLAQAAEFEESALWAPYLHHRACWEAAGDALCAARIAEAFAGIPYGNDDEVEAALSVHAVEAGSRVGLSALERVVAAAMGQLSSERDLARRRLHEVGLLWQPPGLRRHELLPWASRALLHKQGVAESLVPALRHNLVCTPLANEVLTQCLSAEARIRMQLAGKQIREARQEILESQERFRTRNDEFVIYPQRYPLPPLRDEDLWSFAPLGDTLKASSNVPQRFWETLKLRNAVAHGHYVCWHHIRRAWQQLRRFDA